MMLQPHEKTKLISLAKRGDISAQAVLDLYLQMEGAREIDVTGEVPQAKLTGTPPLVDIFHIELPELPTFSSWYLAPAGNFQAKITGVGSSGQTTIQLKSGATLLAQWTVLSSDTPDAFKVADFVNTSLALPGGTFIYFTVTEVATGISGVLTLKHKFLPLAVKNEIFKIP